MSTQILDSFTSNSTVDYKEIPGWPGYRVGSDGSVWSKRESKSLDEWRQLRPGPDKLGTIVARLSGGRGRSNTRRLNDIVLGAFLGPRPANHFASHKDGNRSNCAVENLEWIPRSFVKRKILTMGETELPCKDGVLFKPVESWPGYAVGDDGTIWSAKAWGSRGKWSQINPTFDRDGHGNITFYFNKRHLKTPVPHVVLAAFDGPRPKNHSARHKNKDLSDNRLSNLEWAIHEPASLASDLNFRPIYGTDMMIPGSPFLDSNGEIQTVYNFVPGHPGYMVGSDGSVWMQSRAASKKGYRTISFFDEDGNPSGSDTVHAIVLSTFAGSRPPGTFCCHNDGNPHNNRLENLRWDTPLANSLDRNKHGTCPMGSGVGSAKLDEQEVTEIRRRAKEGERLSALAGEYGVNKTTITYIVSGKTWRHVA